MTSNVPCSDRNKLPESPERRWKIRQLVYGEALAALDATFAALGIEYMPMKGAHLICTGLADKLLAREMHDIDLLVRPRDYEKTLTTLENHPLFTREPPDPWDFEQSFRFRHGGHLIHLEMHYALNRPERFSLATDELFDRALSQTAMRRIMSPEDALIVLVCHTLVHLVDGISDHTFKEASILSQAKGFSWERFETLLQKTGIVRFGRAFLTEAANNQKVGLPKTLHSRWLERAVLTIRTPRRGRGFLTMLFRGGIELFFVRDPRGMLAGYLRGWGAAATRTSDRKKPYNLTNSCR